LYNDIEAAARDEQIGRAKQSLDEQYPWVEQIARPTRIKLRNEQGRFFGIIRV